MTRPSPLLCAALLGLAASLSGCVAAAIPLVAGGAMVVRGDSRDDETIEQAPPPALAKVDLPVENAVSDQSTPGLGVATAPAELPPIAGQSDLAGAIDAVPGAEPAGANESFEGAFPIEDVALAPTEASSLTEAARVAAASGPREPLSLRAYDALYSYVDAQARRDPVEQPRDSALLASPALLRPDRTECSIRPPAVVVDIDPGEASFDPSITPAKNTTLGQMLGAMRQQEIEIYWISSLPAVQAGAVRKALGAAGLDPEGKDQLLLMRNGEDRKQERRRELARSHCIVAIAGDTRSDFDELFAYLKDRSAAQPLEELVGAGWFLTPLPLEQGL